MGARSASRVLAAIAAQHTSTPARKKSTASLALVGDASDLSGGAYPLQTIDVLALAALAIIFSAVLRTARARLDGPPRRAKSQ